MSINFEPISVPGASILKSPEGDEAFLGRDMDNALIIDSGAVSRRHGYLFRAGSRWIYRDLNSSNGSSVNGFPVAAGQNRVLRDGDLLQIADFQMRVHLPSGGEQQQPSVVIFRGERFLQEELCDVDGEPVIIPEDDGGEEPNGGELHIVRNGNELEVDVRTVVCPVRVNGASVHGKRKVRDRDEITYGVYRMLINNPIDVPALTVDSPRRSTSAAAGFGELRSNTFSQSAAPTGRYMDPGLATAPSNRFSAFNTRPEIATGQRESLLTVIVGVVITVGFVAAALYFAFTTL